MPKPSCLSSSEAIWNQFLVDLSAKDAVMALHPGETNQQFLNELVVSAAMALDDLGAQLEHRLSRHAKTTEEASWFSKQAPGSVKRTPTRVMHYKPVRAGHVPYLTGKLRFPGHMAVTQGDTVDQHMVDLLAELVDAFGIKDEAAKKNIREFIHAQVVDPLVKRYSDAKQCLSSKDIHSDEDYQLAIRRARNADRLYDMFLLMACLLLIASAAVATYAIDAGAAHIVLGAAFAGVGLASVALWEVLCVAAAVFIVGAIIGHVWDRGLRKNAEAASVVSVLNRSCLFGEKEKKVEGQAQKQSVKDAAEAVKQAQTHMNAYVDAFFERRVQIHQAEGNKIGETAAKVSSVTC